MEKAKFWLVQIVMVAFASFVFGSPAFASNDNSYAKKRAERWHEKLERKIVKHEKRIAWVEKLLAKYEAKLAKRQGNKRSRWWNKRMKRKINWLERKLAWYEKKLAWYEKKLAEHNAEHHPVQECEEGYTGTYPDCVEEEPDEPVVCGPGTVPDGNGGCMPGCSPPTVGTFPFCHLP